jgi:ribosomal protein S21
MIEVKVDGFPSFHAALKRFKIICQQTGLMYEIRKHREKMSPSEVRRTKRKRIEKRWRKKMRKLQGLQRR